MYRDGGGTTVPGLVSGQTYVAIVDDVNTIRLAVDHANAISGTAVDITGAGAGAFHDVTKIAVSANTAGTIIVLEDINTEAGAADANVAATGEQIILSGNIVLIAAGSEISTATAAGPTATNVYTATGDSVSISGTTGVAFGLGSEVITDGGLANTFAVTLLPAGIIAAAAGADGVPFGIGGNEFLYAYDVLLGANNEINLQVHVDWRDPMNGDIAPTAQAGIFNLLTSDRYQTFTIGDGGQLLRVGHVYHDDNDFGPFADANLVSFFADFSLSHHDSINVDSANILQSTTDDPATGAFNPFNRANLPPADANFTTPGSPDEAADNVDLHFETGLFEIIVQTPPRFVIRQDPPPPEPPAAPAPAPPVAPQQPVFVAAAVPEEAPLNSYSTQSEDYFELRQNKSTEPLPGYERIDDDIGWKLLQPKRLKQWVADEDLNGSNYELWLITTKVKNGQDVTFERPVLKFDVVDQQPFPMTEELPENLELPELRLERLDVDENGNIIEGDPPAEPEADGADALVIPEGESTSRLDAEYDATARSAMAGLAVSSLLAGKRRSRPNSSTISPVARILNGLRK